MALPRVQVPITVSRSDNGNAVAGASIQVNVGTSGTPATVYQVPDPSDSGTLPNPLTTDSNGEVDAYLTPGIYTFNISGAGIPSRSKVLDMRSAKGTTAWTVTNVTPTRSFDPTAATIGDMAQVLATLISDLQGKGDVT